MVLQLAASVALLLFSLSLLRLYFILPRKVSQNIQPQLAPRTRPAHLLVVLGSGGHTTEMLMMLHGLDTRKFTRRTYVISSGDDFSATRAAQFETALQESGEATGMYSVVTVRRARKIHQSLLTAPFSSFICLLNCLQVLYFGAPTLNLQSSAVGDDHKSGQLPPTIPDVIITNGPATGVITVLASLILRFSAFSLPSLSGSHPNNLPRDGRMRIVYVESWARVRHLSLSGRLLLRLVDRFLVQWESLLPATKGRGEYIGALMDVPKLSNT